MATPSDRPTHHLMREILFEALRVTDGRLNALAVETFGRLGDEATRRLVLEAESRKYRPAHRVRALRAIARIGAVGDPSDFVNLFALTMDNSAEVRSAAAYTVGLLRRLESATAASSQGVVGREGRG